MSISFFFFLNDFGFSYGDSFAFEFAQTSRPLSLTLLSLLRRKVLSQCGYIFFVKHNQSHNTHCIRHTVHSNAFRPRRWVQFIHLRTRSIWSSHNLEIIHDVQGPLVCVNILELGHTGFLLNKYSSSKVYETKNLFCC